MITVISGSNRKNSECLNFANKYSELLRKHTQEEVKLLALENIAHDWFSPEMYETPSESLIQLQDEYILPAEKFIFVVPEYNGGVPGALKLFIDACSVRQYQANFKNKKACLAGVATGRAGNLRGLDHLTSVLNHVGTIVLPNKLPISSISNLLNPEKEIIDEGTLAVMEAHVREFLLF